MKVIYPAMVWGTLCWYKKLGDSMMEKRMIHVLGVFHREFGVITRIIPPVIGITLYFSLKLETHKLSRGWTYEPPTSLRRNAAAQGKSKKLKNSNFKALVNKMFHH